MIDEGVKELKRPISFCSVATVQSRFYQINKWLLISQVTFPKVKVRLKLDSLQKNIPQLTQVCLFWFRHSYRSNNEKNVYA